MELLFDVVVIGGGIAGMVAANRASELGKRVALLEKGTESKYLCNSRFTGGTFHVCLNDAMSAEEFLLTEIQASTAGFSRPETARALAHDCSRVLHWLERQGVRFIKFKTGAAAAVPGWVLAPPAHIGPGLNWEGRGGDVMLQTLEAALVKRSGKIFRGARATRLLMADGHCIGVIADSAEGPLSFHAQAIVIADGGFQGNADLVKSYIAKSPERLRQRGAGTGTGDGLRMAEAVGARSVGLGCFYGHPLSRDALTNDKLWPYPYLDQLTLAGIVLGPDGKRFADEGRSGVYIANKLAHLDDPTSAIVVFDEAIWAGPGRLSKIPVNPHLKNAGATIHKADTLEALAELIGVPAADFCETVVTYNSALEAGTLSQLSPPRRTDLHKPWLIRTPPFYGVPMCPGITYTMGGIAIDEFGRVLDVADEPIPGLFAAGTTTGGLEGGPEIGYVGGLISSSTMGLRAAETIAE